MEHQPDCKETGNFSHNSSKKDFRLQDSKALGLSNMRIKVKKGGRPASFFCHQIMENL